MGLGITAMHYTGMGAMSMQADMTYSIPYVFASMIIAIIASGGALLLAFNVGHLPEMIGLPGRLMAAFLMALAICGMHYTGMYALSIHPFADCRYIDKQSFYGLTTAATVATGLIFGVSAYLVLKPDPIKPYSPYH
jgi:NO-binding membrane sensor protein with MHYT domain